MYTYSMNIRSVLTVCAVSFWCRLIFLGSPCDPNQPNTMVTRAMPLTALYQLKKTGPQALPRHGINIVEGLQMRSVTGQVSDYCTLSIRCLHIYNPCVKTFLLNLFLTLFLLSYVVCIVVDQDWI